jgi:hypothetical protein
MVVKNQSVSDPIWGVGNRSSYPHCSTRENFVQTDFAKETNKSHTCHARMYQLPSYQPTLPEQVLEKQNCAQPQTSYKQQQLDIEFVSRMQKKGTQEI